MDDDGDFVIAWASDAQDGYNDGIYAQRFSSTGGTLGSEFRGAIPIWPISKVIQRLAWMLMAISSSPGRVLTRMDQNRVFLPSDMIQLVLLK